MCYNAHSVMKDYYTFQDLYWMPIREVLDLVQYFMPKIKEIARQQEAEKIKSELTGKRNGMKPGNKGGRNS